MSSQITIPSWLNEQYIKKALRQAEGDKIKVKKINVGSATAPGDNYSSLMYRVIAEYDVDTGSNVQHRKKSFVVKANLDNEFVKKIIAESGVANNELIILTKIIPAFQQLLDSCPSDETFHLAPKCYLYSTEPNYNIVMEDLCESGHQMAQRTPGLDLDHSKLVFERLGVLHAASVALYSTQPKLFDSFLPVMHARGGEASKNFVTQSLIAVAEKVQTWPGKAQKYAEKLRRLSKTAHQCLLDIEQRDDQGFNVFVHGDVWTNNMMFRYNEDGKVFDMTFLDIGGYYGPPSLDLLYFLYTSPTPEVRRFHKEELVECYHSSLLKTLTRLGYGQLCPSLDEIRTEMNNKSMMGLYAFCCVRTIAVANKDSLPDVGKLCEESSDTASCAHITGDYDKELQELLPVFEKEGLFD